jgi:cyclopropane fatty-acyl-phospholipid synthase-like methyltransferase
MKFNKEYTEYWEAAVSRSIDGTVIAGEQQVKHFLKLLGINNVQKMLDLGSSFGRMYPVLAEFGENIYGCEPDPFAIERCKEYPYVEVKNGTGENT